MAEKNSNLATGTSGPCQEEDGNSGGIRTVEMLLRLFPVGLCVAALVVMIKDSETNDYGSLSYSNFTGFRFLVHANGVLAGYSLVTAAFTAVPRPMTMPRAWTFFLLDQVSTYLILAAGAVTTELTFLAYKGDVTVTWSEACGTYGHFCKQATASIIITFLVVICYILLSLISSYRLFSKYDAPVGYRNKGIEIVDFGN
ncbi:putative casparian strip membrane protein [Helianthus annuus]|uniref:CASP-like protein n=1 Tax=Helianthus annuus TaxID=4232 RepID=A0A251T8F9_HELAN|nr:CASP-like protein 2A1 [Helianthus annuus]KAF5780648.1 putative casparian strip membrane protein [Helianthus annuus]KAJ0516263.1 putative casparian strip membrane protein [Helianthus annuus]KAJ0873858.1 putative casparian strip membrane protein [Helianthus annuus]